jgi:lysophospholipase L1-like esterase
VPETVKLAEMIKAEIDRMKLHCERIACLGDSTTYGAGMTGHGTATGDTYPGVLKQLLSK